MGGSNSKISDKSYLSKSDNEIVSLMMPVFFTFDEVTKEDAILATESWKLIVDEKSDHFNQLKLDQNFKYTSCILYFFDVFYDRLFDVHPLCEPMFKSGIKAQGRFLVKMISLSVSLLDDKKKFEETMINLANAHNKRGVRANEYGIVGEVLFYSVKKCIGPAYTPNVHLAWIKIFSRMLKYIVPTAVAFELHEGYAQVQRMNELDMARKQQVQEFNFKNENEKTTTTPSTDSSN